MTTISSDCRVAIALAVYNDERYLRLTLEALALQTWRHFHVIVLDDGSTDGSGAAAEAYAARLPLTVMRGARRGRHDAKRAVADAALALGTPYLLVLDSDIALPHNALAEMVALLDGDAAIG